jgi:hypothetical protein
MTAAEHWLQAARTVYDGDDVPVLVDRALRGKAEVDRITFAYLAFVCQEEILDELRLIRRALEAAPKRRSCGGQRGCEVVTGRHGISSTRARE